MRDERPTEISQMSARWHGMGLAVKEVAFFPLAPLPAQLFDGNSGLGMMQRHDADVLAGSVNGGCWAALDRNTNPP